MSEKLTAAKRAQYEHYRTRAEAAEAKLEKVRGWAMRMSGPQSVVRFVQFVECLFFFHEVQHQLQATLSAIEAVRALMAREILDILDQDPPRPKTIRRPRPGDPPRE